MKKLLILLIKFIPVIQMAGMLVNNTLCVIDYNGKLLTYIDFIFGNSLIATFLIIVCSYVFGFCLWHRLIIIANFVNIIIANLDKVYYIPITDIHLLSVYYIIYSIFIIIATIIHIKRKKL